MMIKNMNMNNKKFNILLIVVFISLAIILPIKSFQNDTFYTIKVGESLIKNGLDMKDHFSFINGLSYSYPHLLFDISIYFIYSLFGFTGIYINTIILSFILISLLYFIINKEIDNKYLSLTIVIFLSILLRPYLTARAQLVSYIILLILLYLISKESKKNYPYIFILGIILSNTHPAIFPVALILYVPFIINNIFEKKELKTLIKSLFISILSGLFTFNFNPFTYVIKTKMDVSMSYISEHFPSTITSKPFLYILVFIIFTLLIINKKKIKINDFLLIVGFATLSFISQRSFALFLILSSVSMAKVFNTYIIERKINIEKIITNRVVYICLLTFFLSSIIVMINYNKNKEYIDSKIYPVSATLFIKDNLDINNLRMYNDYNYGSYLLFNDIKVFIDSRSDLYTRGFNKECTIFNDAMKIEKNYKNTFKKYNINHVITYNESTLNLLLKSDNDYSILYKDDTFTIYKINLL